MGDRPVGEHPVTGRTCFWRSGTVQLLMDGCMEMRVLYHERWRWRLVGVVLVFWAGLLVPWGVGLAEEESESAVGSSTMAMEGEEELFLVPPPPFTEGMYPCSMCHEEMETNRRRRKLEEFHDDIVLRHDEKHRWCLDCHDADDRDRLHLASGELVGFEESYRLCGQCHGTIYRDWRAGIHGKRIGQWNGEKRYLLCAHCHDPHQPAFKPIHPFPAPMPPEAIK
jgi:hypothetical protein